MHLNRMETLKKALLDTQERVRDYMNYSEQISDEKLSACFREHAELEARHATALQGFIAGK